MRNRKFRKRHICAYRSIWIQYFQIFCANILRCSIIFQQNRTILYKMASPTDAAPVQELSNEQYSPSTGLIIQSYILL